MRLHTAGWGSILASTLLITSTLGKKDKPAITSSDFGFIPLDVSYFEDSDVILFADGSAKNMYRSDDAGETWAIVDGPPQGRLVEMTMHPFDHKRAYYIGDDAKHWSTTDRGKTWQEFKTDKGASQFRTAMSFHAGDPDRIIFTAMDCMGVFCEEVTYYTTDNFKTSKYLRDGTAGCHWAKSSEIFTTGNKDMDKDRIVCITRGRFSVSQHDFRLLISDDFFQKSGSDLQEFEPELEPGRTVQGIVNMAVVKGYLIVAASAQGTDEMALYVSDDAIKWHRAIFPHDHKLTENAYTILEGTDYSIQIDVMNSRASNPMGVFLSSNSNGTYFTRNIERTNRNRHGLVDFEKVSGIQGIVLVNVVDNFEEIEEGKGAAKKVISKISFNDGRDFQDLTAKKEKLHLHSVTELSNSGRVFSSPAPGLVMGIGNIGKHLKDYADGNLYVSDDAGLTWIEGLKGPHKYEFGDQGSILVAIKDDWTDEIRYSFNHGKDWSKAELPESIRPIQLTTTQDSTSLKFLLEGLNNKDSRKTPSKSFIMSIDFDDMHEAKCDADKDFEKWWARVDDDGKPMCLMGHKQWYHRRKADSNCFVRDVFHDPEAHQEDCECTDTDFECDYNFERTKDRKECERKGPLVIPEGECKNPDDKFKGSSGWRKIPENTCKGGLEKDKPRDRACSEGHTGTAPPATGKISSTKQAFDGKIFEQVQYLERTSISSGGDETVLMRTDAGLWYSDDHGKSFSHILKDEDITAIIPHPYFSDIVFFRTPTKKVFYSTERGKNIRSFDAPFPPSSDDVTVMNFHSEHKDWIIWLGGRDCPGTGCHTVASYTKDRGDGPWTTLQRYVRKCEFIKDPHIQNSDPSQQEYGKKTPTEVDRARDRLIYCAARTRESSDDVDNPWRLVSSDDLFDNDHKAPFDNIVDFATMSEFLVVATKDLEHETLNFEASVNGRTFAAAEWPHGFKVDHQQAFTVLDSSTHSVFLHVTTNGAEGTEYGTIVKSNSNGTSYVKTLDYVDRNPRGYVDFEKSYGIEGVALVNVVANYDDKNIKKNGKMLKTLITHNDGAEWDYITPPKKDADDKDFGCSSSDTSKCALHIHGYTERKVKSRTYTSTSAVGLMIGTGNVGEHLTSDHADTFMSSDAGLSWKPVKKGKYIWEYGDQGSIVVIVSADEQAATKVLYYTLNEGDTWEEYPFTTEPMHVAELTTVPSDNSRNFLLWGTQNGKLTTYNVDFSGLTDKQCKLDEEDVTAGDYYLWTPKHPKQDDDCLFGHVSQYHRKKIDSQCYNGRMIPHLHDIAMNCTCTRRDFECDFNYQRQTDGSCALVPGFSPPDHSLVCKQDDNRVEYYEPTGYRRISISTCDGGLEMDKIVAQPCPGKDEQFNKKHGASGVVIFFAVVIPFVVAGGVGYWIWKNWANKFGQIRLGEQSPFDGDAPWIKYPVLVIAGLAAVAQALPLLLSSLWRSASNVLGRGTNRRFTTRDSFARGRGDYAVVDEDEGELLGDDSDEEV